MSPPNAAAPGGNRRPVVAAMQAADGTTVRQQADNDGHAGVWARRRREAAFRLQPIRDGFGLSRHDPWLNPVGRGPSTFGLRPGELAAEGSRCAAAGWQHWEIVERLANPAVVAVTA